MEQPFEKPPFWPAGRAPFACYRELDTFLRMSSFAWHAELACRKWLERGTTSPGGLNIPKTTHWMAVLSYVNPPLDAAQQFGISPDDVPDVSILRAYQLLISGLFGGAGCRAPGRAPAAGQPHRFSGKGLSHL